MEDHNAINKMVNQIKNISKNNYNNKEYLTSMELLLTSENDGRVKDAEIANQFNDLKNKIDEVDKLSNELLINLQMNLQNEKNI